MEGTINMAGVVRRYFKNRNEPPPEDLTFGLSCLNPNKSLGLINDMLTFCDAAHKRGHVSPEIVEKYNLALEQSKKNKGPLSSMRLLLEKSRVDARRHQVSWYDNNYRSLCKERMWEEFKRLAKINSRKKICDKTPWLTADQVDEFIIGLKQEWQGHGEFSRHSSHMLLVLYDEIIPLLEDVVKSAIWELRLYWWRVPGEVRRRAQRLFNSILKMLTQSKPKILASMKARVMIADFTGDPMCDDVIKYWRDAIFSIVPDPQENENKFFFPKRGLTAELHAAFCEHIMCGEAVWGMAHAPQCIEYSTKKDYPWLRKGKASLGVLVRSESSAYAVIPEKYFLDVPDWPGVWLITPGRYYRYHFFEGVRSVLVKALRYKPEFREEELRTQIKYLERMPFLYRLRMQERLIRQDLSEIKNDLTQKYFTHFFQGGTLNFMASWKNFLKEKGREVVENKVCLLDSISKILNNRSMKNSLKSFHKERVVELVEEVRENIHYYGCDQFSYNRFTQAVSQIKAGLCAEELKVGRNAVSACVEIDDPDRSVLRLAGQLAEGRLLPEHELGQVINYVRINIGSNLQSYFSIVLSNAMQCARKIVLREFSRHVFSLSSEEYKKHLAFLRQSVTLLRDLKNFSGQLGVSFDLQSELYGYANNFLSNFTNPTARSMQKYSGVFEFVEKFGRNWLSENFGKLRKLGQSEASRSLLSVNVYVVSDAIRKYVDQRINDVADRGAFSHNG